MLPVLYKISKNEKTQTWRMELSGNKYRTISGFEDGEKVTSEWTVCSGKNIGRSNETTPEQQAKLEVEAKYTEKLDRRGYSKTKNQANSKDTSIVPMLAKQYEDYTPTEEQFRKHKVYCQPKLDGVRCIATKDGLFSRKGKKFTSCPHIEESLKPLFKEDPSLILDGELYADKLADDFNQIISIVRKEKDIDLNLAKKISYHVYDVIRYKNSDTELFSKRTSYIHKLLIHINYVICVKTYLADSQDALDNLCVQFVNAGYEGQMVRIDGPYEKDRSKLLLKRKEFDDSEFTIIDIKEGEGNRSGMAGKIVYKISDTVECESGIRGNEEFYKELLKNKKKYIGGQGTVRYFGFTPAGKLRFPVTVAVYESKRDI